MADYGQRDNGRIREMNRRRIQPVRTASEGAGGGPRRDRGKRGRRRKRRFLSALFLLFFLIAAGVGLFRHFARYDSYAVMWQKNLGEGSLVGYESFGAGVLKYSKDGVSYLTGRGDISWVDSYEMKNPTIDVSGDYAVIADLQGNAVRIYSREGKTGEITTVLPLTGASAAENGIAAVIQEDASASYIVFFRKDGSPLDITVKSVLDGDGYPTALSLSPDGSRLMVSYAYLEGGEVRGRVVFYDFSEIGKSTPNRLVGGFDEPFASALVAEVQYLGDSYSFAASSAGLCFFSSRNLASPELVRRVDVAEEIRSLFYSEKYVGIVVQELSGESRYRMELYRRDGSKAMERRFDDNYQTAAIDGEMIFLLSPGEGTIFNTAGIRKFHGALDFPVVYMQNGPAPGEFLMAGPSNLKAVRLR